MYSFILNLLLFFLTCICWRNLVIESVKLPTIWHEVTFISLLLDSSFVHITLGFPCSSAGKESTCHAGNLGLIPGLERSLVEGKGYPLQYSGLENSMNCIVHRVTESDTTEQLSLLYITYLPLCPSGKFKNNIPYRAHS